MTDWKPFNDTFYRELLKSLTEKVPEGTFTLEELVETGRYAPIDQ